jgi:hypothetical protein
LYDPGQYLTMEVFAKVAAEFDWPAPYLLEDDLPDGVTMVFPQCHLVFIEGFESEIALQFLPLDTGWDHSLAMNGILATIGSELVADAGGRPQLNLLRDAAAGASVEKVENGIRGQCTLVLTHFSACIRGDFSWVDTYAAHYQHRP